MKQTKLMMDMSITVEIVDDAVTIEIIDKIFNYFKYIDNKFSAFKETSEITKINKGELKEKDYSVDMKIVLDLCQKTKDETNGYFNIKKEDKLDPSGLVKGWAIYEASKILKKQGFENFYIDAGGDIQTYGLNAESKPWRVGIRNPFNRKENVKVVTISNQGIATSGTYIRGQHIYNPFDLKEKIRDIVSLTVIGPNIYEADRFATAAFSMGKKGIEFIEKLKGFEGYIIDNKGIATYTSGFNNYVFKNDKSN